MKGCPDCDRRAEQARLRNKRRQLRLAEMGMCECGRVPAKGRVRCHKCLMSQRLEKQRRKLRAA